MKLLLLISKGIIRDGTTRRWAMFFSVLAALLLLFLGSTFLAGFLSSRPVLFVFFWIVCGWLTLLAILLALYDMIAVRAATRAERKRLRREVFGARDGGDDER